MIRFQSRDAVLRGFDLGRGSPLVFQHGLGGSEAQVTENLPDLPDIRRLTLESRGQGGSDPGHRRPFSIGMFADDVLEFCDARGVGHFVAGGISMGAAIALRLAVRHPARVGALILARPAWLFDPAPETMRPYAEVASALRTTSSRAEAKARFQASPTAARLGLEAPDNLASLLRFFDSPDAAVTASLLADIAADGPGVTRDEAAALRLPTLVIGHTVDHVHPLATAEALASTIPGATLVRIPPKANERAAHVAAFRAAVATFLERLPAATEPPA